MGFLAGALVSGCLYRREHTGVLTRKWCARWRKIRLSLRWRIPFPKSNRISKDDVAVIATGRMTTESDQRFSFPGVLWCFRLSGSYDYDYYMEAATVIAALVKPSDLNREHIIPSVFDERAAAVAASRNSFSRSSAPAEHPPNQHKPSSPVPLVIIINRSVC